MTERTTLRRYLEQFGMTVEWLTDEGHARIGGIPSDPYFEPYSSSIRRDKSKRIPVFKAVGHGRLIFMRSLLNYVTPARVGLSQFLRSPIASIIFLGLIIYAKFNGTFDELQGKSEIVISIEAHNQLGVAHFPFDEPVQFRGTSFKPGTFYVRDSNGNNWLLDNTLLTLVNFIEFEPELEG